MQVSNTQTYTRFSSDTRRNSDVEERRERRRNFIGEEAKKVPAKVGAKNADVSTVAFKNIRAGRNLPSADALLEWAHNDKAFAVALAIHIGVILPGDAEAVEAMMRGVHAFMRRRE